MKLNLTSGLLSVIFLSFNIVSHSVTASDTSAYKARLVEESLLLDITSNNQQVVTVGERGHILLSKDGLEWRQADVPSKSMLTSVYFVGQDGWAVGHDSTILHSNDNGQSWEVQMFQPELEKPLLDVLFFDQEHGIAIGAYGAYYRTINGGKDWEREMHPEFLSEDDQAYLNEVRQEDEAFYQQELASILPHLNRVTMADGHLYLAGEAGLLAESDDLGKSWKRMHINYYGSFFDIAQTPSGRMLAAGLRGNLFEYDQENQQWLSIRTGTTSSLNSIVADGESVLVVGNNGVLIKLTPEGLTLSQTDDGKAVLNALNYAGQLIAVTGVGIKHLQQGQ